MHNTGFTKYVRTLPFSAYSDKMKNSDISLYFLPREIELYGGGFRKKSLAVRWLVKEILIEHFGQQLSFLQICITNHSNGKPELKISNKKITDAIHISMSHSRNYITAMVVIENEVV